MFKYRVLFFVFVLSLVFIFLLKPLAFIIFSMPIHELGHAVASWLCSRPALPIIFGGFTFISSNQSLILKCILLLILTYVLIKAYTAEFRWRFSFLLLLFFIFLYLSFKASSVDREKTILLAGQFFEIVWPALLVSFYFFNYLEIEKWSFWRHVSLIYGLPALILSASFWYNVYMSNQSLPFGSALSSDGMSSKDGDLNRLIAMGMTEQSIAHVYFVTLSASIAVVILFFLVYVLTETEAD